MKHFVPMSRMKHCVSLAKDDSASAAFNDLMAAGEQLLKSVTLGMVAALEDDRQRHKYRQVHRLVRANGLGEWSDVLADVLTGPASAYLRREAHQEKAELVSLFEPGAWQHRAASQLHSVLVELRYTSEREPRKLTGQNWIEKFVTLRNKTRGHGAPKHKDLERIVSTLEESIYTFSDEFSLFSRPWAHLHRNLSGKYRVSQICGPEDAFSSLKQWNDIALGNGVHIYYGDYCPVDLIYTDAELTDFHYANGHFKGKSFEALSYITDSRQKMDTQPYLAPATPLPDSETVGMKQLDVVGRCFANIPPAPANYVHRSALEQELRDALLDDRHPVITLVGRGGIGKTWLTLTALHQVCESERFEAVIWFSARDIDLLAEGPKQVKRDVLRQRDIAKLFVQLADPAEAREKNFSAEEYFSQALTRSPLEAPILFVFDNFETVQNPTELYNWIDE